MKIWAQLVCWSRQRKMYHFQNVLAICALTISWKVKSVAYSLVDLKFPEVSAAYFYLYLTRLLLFASMPFLDPTPSYPAKAGCLSRLRSTFMFSNAVITCLFWSSIYILLWFIILKNKIIFSRIPYYHRKQEKLVCLSESFYLNEILWEYLF